MDYVELYNNTDKTFDLSALMLGVIKESFPNPADTTLKEITAENRLFLPHTYVLFSTNSESLANNTTVRPTITCRWHPSRVMPTPVERPS